jgi:hypothetical protein
MQCLPIFGVKIGAFHKSQCYDQIFAKTSLSVRKNADFLPKKLAKIFF